MTRLPIAFLMLVLITGGALVAVWGCSGDGNKSAHQHSAGYRCPMHPTYTSDRPGDCAICGMKLVPIAPEGKSMDTLASAPTPGVATGTRRLLFYRNPMDASITSPVAMKDGMGMDYIAVYSDERGAASTVPGRAVVELGPEEMGLTGIQTTVARRGSLTRTVRAVGEVKVDETRVRQVQTKISGWVEKLFVSSSGQAVRKGQPLLTLYSPELLATQQEFVRALESAAQFAQSNVPEVRRGGQELVESARRRLQLFDVPQKFLAQLERTRQPQRAVTLDAPVSGFVSSKDVSEGMQVTPGMTLFTITDLSRVWIEAEVYEYEASLVRIGQRARLTLPNEPGVVHMARIQYIYPFLDTQTRTLRVRFVFDNPGQVLKPGMYANVDLDGDAAEGVLIPDAAIMDTGLRQIV
ncbi:MAG: efflux RND transporter periplasmic adaptor subunit, partial [Candidatus Eisenbacteria bacterium]